MANSYAAVSALIFAIVALGHLARINKAMERANRATRGAHVRVMDRPCDCGLALDLGFYAVIRQQWVGVSV